MQALLSECIILVRCVPTAGACAATEHTFVLLATEVQKARNNGIAWFLVNKPNNTINQDQVLPRLREEYVKVPPQPAEMCSALD